MKQLPEKFLARMKAQLGAEYGAFLASYALPPVRGLRVNTLKLGVAEFLRISPWELAPSNVIPEGFTLAGAEEHIGSHPYHAAGLFYMQEPSAMSAIAELDIRPSNELRVLDMCASPGGKAGGAAARMAGQGLLVANEIVPQRAKTLQFTLERLGVMNAAVTCARPDAIAEALAEFFDVIIVDAPCSGEGMFRKDDTAIAEWSPEHVSACAQRQAAILNSAYAALAENGRLIYSTCTFSPEEDEGAVEAFIAAHTDMRLVSMQRYYPHTGPGEGHFAAVLQKLGGRRMDYPAMKFTECKDRAYTEFASEYLGACKGVQLADGRVMRLMDALLPVPIASLRLLNAGVQLGELVRGRFEPAHQLALMADRIMQRSVSLALTDARLAAFMRGESIAADMQDGWCTVNVGEYALGLGKSVQGTVKNHIPKGIRIR